MLTTMIDRLPQPLDQVSAAVRRHSPASLIRMDDGTSQAKPPKKPFSTWATPRTA